MDSAERPLVIPGSGPVVLVAPHGGRRDPVRHPWNRGGLRVNDLRTPALTEELAARLDASAVINAAYDRNDVDLNRISEAHDRAADFLAHLGDVLDATLALHGHVTLLTVHGWNVGQPALDLGLGCAPNGDPFAVGRGAAVSPTFAAGTVRRLVAACGTRGLTATVGARYPARHRENLLQLFTPRYRDDPRALVRRLAALAPSVDAVQLELAIPLRWPGRWREAFLDACAETFASGPPAAAAPVVFSVPPASSSRLQFTAPAACGLVSIETGGGRLLLFPPGGGLVLFTGERVAGDPAVGPLTVERLPDGCRVRFKGPMLRFEDTLPFLDLEPGLARATLLEADVALDFAADDTAQGPGGRFGALTGHARIGDKTVRIAGDGFEEGHSLPTAWPWFRTQLRLGHARALVLTLGLADGRASGSLQRDGAIVPVVAARAALGPDESPLAHVQLDVELADGSTLEIGTRALHRLPVVRGRAERALRLEFAASLIEGGPSWPAGWCEVGGL